MGLSILKCTSPQTFSLAQKITTKKDINHTDCINKHSISKSNHITDYSQSCETQNSYSPFGECICALLVQPEYFFTRLWAYSATQLLFRFFNLLYIYIYNIAFAFHHRSGNDDVKDPTDYQKAVDDAIELAGGQEQSEKKKVKLDQAAVDIRVAAMETEVQGQGKVGKTWPERPKQIAQF